ncbi:ATP-binding cassette domain-containing protein [Sedimentibacter sp.]|uniref:ABC transporter ATP-binding protein n=1 Tax=Sedimentibacter sp. TaxID=1960295 RepID=UPI0028AF5F97|nr:ATP-binding cassette domain-containing protein [Sedimentibacter sp.]
MKTVIEVKNIRKEYIVKKHFLTGKTQEKVTAVKNSSFKVEEGKTVGIVGESGSGKSTTGEIAGGLQKPSYGNVFYYGKNIEEMTSEECCDYRKNVQFIFQDPKGSMDPNYTVGDNIAFPLITFNIEKNKKDAMIKVEEMLEKVGLDKNIKNKYPSEISGGQCQRAAIARALAVNPKVIVCDEPVSALDVSVQAQILNLLKKLQKEYNISYIFISHDIGVVNYMSDMIIVMSKGNIVEMGEAKEVFLNPKESYTKKLLESAFYEHRA